MKVYGWLCLVWRNIMLNPSIFISELCWNLLLGMQFSSKLSKLADQFYYYLLIPGIIWGFTAIIHWFSLVYCTGAICQQCQIKIDLELCLKKNEMRFLKKIGYFGLTNHRSPMRSFQVSCSKSETSDCIEDRDMKKKLARI